MSKIKFPMTEVVEHDTAMHTEQFFELVGETGAGRRLVELVESGICTEARSAQFLETPLVAVSRYDSARDAVSALIAAGADVNAEDSLGNTALLYATLNGNAKMVDELLKPGEDGKIAVDITHTNHLGLSALDTAFDDIAEKLRKAMTTQLFASSEQPGDRLEIAKMMLAAGADSSIPNNAGQTPIEIARANGLEDVATLLESAALRRQESLDLSKQRGAAEAEKYIAATDSSNMRVPTFGTGIREPSSPLPPDVAALLKR